MNSRGVSAQGLIELWTSPAAPIKETLQKSSWNYLSSLLPLQLLLSQLGCVVFTDFLVTCNVFLFEAPVFPSSRACLTWNKTQRKNHCRAEICCGNVSSLLSAGGSCLSKKGEANVNLSLIKEGRRFRNTSLCSTLSQRSKKVKN